MHFSSTALLVIALGAISSINAHELEARACNRAQASSILKKNHYTKFCSSLIRGTVTTHVTETSLSTNAASTVTVTSHPLTTVTNTLLQVSNTFVATDTVSVTGATTTVANPSLPAQNGARNAYRSRPTKPAKVSKCAYQTLSAACKQIVTKKPKAVTATETETVSGNVDVPAATVTVQGDVQTVTQFGTSVITSTGTATTSVSATATATAAAFLAFRDVNNNNLIRQLEFDSDATAAHAPAIKYGQTVSTNAKATIFAFRATGGSAVAPATTPPNPAHDGLVSGIFTEGSGATQRCLAVSAAPASIFETVACDATVAASATPDLIFTAQPITQFSINPNFLYVYSGVFPAQLNQITFVSSTTPPSYKYGNPATGGMTVFLQGTNSTGF